MLDTWLSPPLLFHLEIAVEGASAVVRCTGEIDLSNVDRLQRVLGSVIASGAQTIHVDLRAVPYLDSCTMELLLSADAELRRDGRRLQVAARPFACRLFRVVGIETTPEEGSPEG
jgi:anti-anti-sigma factor